MNIFFAELSQENALVIWLLISLGVCLAGLLVMGRKPLYKLAALALYGISMGVMLLVSGVWFIVRLPVTLLRHLAPDLMPSQLNTR